MKIQMNLDLEKHATDYWNCKKHKIYRIYICMDLPEFFDMSHFFLKQKLHFLAKFAQIFFFIFGRLHLLQQALFKALQAEGLLPITQVIWPF